MSQDQEDRIQRVHAPLIHQVVNACHDISAHNELDMMLQQALAHGWEELVVAIRRILNGERDKTLLNGLDEEDTVIIRSILNGLADPATLPEPATPADPALAAPGLAMLIHQARQGETEAMQTLESMAEHMRAIPGDMHYLGAAILRMVGDDWDMDALGKDMTARGQTLLVDVLTELGKLARH